MNKIEINRLKKIIKLKTKKGYKRKKKMKDYKLKLCYFYSYF